MEPRETDYGKGRMAAGRLPRLDGLPRHTCKPGGEAHHRLGPNPRPTTRQTGATTSMNDQARQMLDTMMKAQWADPATLDAHQDRMLGRLVAHAAAQTAAYAERLKPVIAPDGSIDLSRWDEVPVLTREQAQADTDAIVARETPPEAGASQVNATSGSTGRAFRHRRSAIMSSVDLAASARGMRWFGVSGDETLASITVGATAKSGDPQAGHYKRGSWDIGGGTGRHAAMSINSPVSRQSDWLDDVRPAYLRTYPSNAAALARQGRPRAWHRGLKAVLCLGEVVTQEQRADVRREIGCAMINTYGATETGSIAYECPESGLMHVVSEAIRVELLDGNGRVVAPGEIGEVVVTPLWNYAMPLIRYRLGDHARQVAGACSCGRGLPVIGEVIGRSRNMFQRPDGERFWPNMYSAEFNQFIPHLQYQIVQKDACHIELVYVPRAQDQTEDRDGMLAYARRMLFPQVKLSYRATNEIPRHASGKYEDYRCEIP
jgi:phenylacetate-CoA ligase